MKMNLNGLLGQTPCLPVLLVIWTLLPMVGGAYPSGGIQVEQVLSGSKSRVPSSAAVSDALGSESNRIDSIVGNISNSYVVVNGTNIYFAEFFAGHPVFDSGGSERISFFANRWNATFDDEVNFYTNSSSSYLPPYSGWVNTTNASDIITVEFYMGQYMTANAETTPRPLAVTSDYLTNHFHSFTWTNNAWGLPIYVHPDKRNLYGSTACDLSTSLPLTTWPNSVLWVTADSPTVNSGTTNATWICYASTCAGNATQVDLNKQPSRVYTDSAWAWSFDGVDDYLITPKTNHTDNFTVKVRFMPDAIPADESGFVVSQYKTDGDNRMWAISQRAAGDSGVLRFTTATDGGAGLINNAYIAQSNISPTMATYIFVKSGTNVTCTVDGVPVTVDGAVDETLPDKNAPVAIGATAAGTSGFAGIIEEVVIY